MSSANLLNPTLVKVLGQSWLGFGSDTLDPVAQFARHQMVSAIDIRLQEGLFEPVNVGMDCHGNRNHQRWILDQNLGEAWMVQVQVRQLKQWVLTSSRSTLLLCIPRMSLLEGTGPGPS